LPNQVNKRKAVTVVSASKLVQVASLQ